ncbi:MAG: hypothetical protein K5841_07875 [Fretibacterium sp.]|nr:hypothetical protein [Fretibacterium sp.]
MKKTFFMSLIMLISLSHAAAAGVTGPAAIDKSGDTALQAMIQETEGKFSQLNYTEGNLSLLCNLFLPEGYPGSQKYPLVIFIADSSTVGREADAPLRQGYGGIIWATEKEQSKHPCIVLVPQYPQEIVDDSTGSTAAAYISITENLIRAVIDGFQVDTGKIYATGQAMGCMALMIMAEKNPALFAAELFVAGQGELREIEGLKKQKFFYITSEGDDRARIAQAKLLRRFQIARVPFSRTLEWDARQAQEDFANALNVMLAGRPSANFARFIEGTVLPPGVSSDSSLEHLYSFDAAYRINALRDWLFMQSQK